MKFRIDYRAFYSITVEADNEDDAIELARKELNNPLNRAEFIGNAEVTGVDVLENEDDEQA